MMAALIINRYWTILLDVINLLSISFKHMVQCRIESITWLLLCSLECRDLWLHTNVWLLFLLLNVVIWRLMMQPILVLNLLLRLDNSHIYVHLLALFIQI